MTTALELALCSAQTLVVSGVKFMGETSKILSAPKTVLPDLDAAEFIAATGIGMLRPLPVDGHERLGRCGPPTALNYQTRKTAPVPTPSTLRAYANATRAAGTDSKPMK